MIDMGVIFMAQRRGSRSRLGLATRRYGLRANKGAVAALVAVADEIAVVLDIAPCERHQHLAALLGGGSPEAFGEGGVADEAWVTDQCRVGTFE